MSIELIEPPAQAQHSVIKGRNGVEARCWSDAPGGDTDVNLTLRFKGGAVSSYLSADAARELAAALLLCADAVEGV